MTTTNEMYKSIIRTYFNHRENHDYWFAGCKDEMAVVTEAGEEHCSIFETPQDCFEDYIVCDFEEMYTPEDPFDFSIFTQEQIAFMRENYPDSGFAEQIAAKYATEPGDKEHTAVLGTNWMREKLNQHIGHEIVCAAYGDAENPADICIECEDCGCVVVSAEDFEPEPLAEETAAACRSKAIELTEEEDSVVRKALVLLLDAVSEDDERIDVVRRILTKLALA